MYSSSMTKRTTINLDMDVLEHARTVLGTKKTTETVHRALEEVIRRDARESLAQWDLGGLTPDHLTEMRKPRFSAER